MKQSQLNNAMLMLSKGKGVHLFSPAEIIRLEASDNYTKIFPVNHKPFMASKVLKIFQDMLEPYGFIRTHRSHIVNACFIRNIQAERVIMEDESIAEISRRKRPGLMKALKSGTDTDHYN